MEMWGANDEPPAFMIRAAADRIRGTQRVNSENAFDVIRIFGCVKDMGLREITEENRALYDVQFEDESQLIIVATPDGMGSSAEAL